MRDGYFASKRLWCLMMASLFVALVMVIITPGPSSALDGRDGNAYVNFHRDRLLDTYAQYQCGGTSGKCHSIPGGYY